MSFTHFNFFFSYFNIIFMIIFFIILAVIIYQAFRGIRTWISNNRAEVIQVPAKVISKRQMTSIHGSKHATSGSTTYYITFEIRGNVRNEFRVKGNIYGLIAEGDFGILKFQGTRFLGFKLDTMPGA